ncbi:MAG TPA: hypothetical protein VIJ68_00295 [Candidatus Saccharimonadales bacterium]
MAGERIDQAAPAGPPQVYENEHGVACLAPYVRVVNWSPNGVHEVGAVVKGVRMGMDEVAQLDPEQLAAEGVVAPDHAVSLMHTAAAERRRNQQRHSAMPPRIGMDGYGYQTGLTEIAHAA